jgi:hypothetical protein
VPSLIDGGHSRREGREEKRYRCAIHKLEKQALSDEIRRLELAQAPPPEPERRDTPTTYDSNEKPPPSWPRTRRTGYRGAWARTLPRPSASRPRQHP